MEWTRGNIQQQINNQPLMGVAKAGRDKAVKSNAAPAVNGAFCRHMDHGRGGKVGINGRAGVCNSQDNNHLKVMVAGGGFVPVEAAASNCG